MRRLILTVAVLGIPAGVAPIAAAQSTATSTLYSLQARGGTLRPAGAGSYRLTLRGLAPQVTAFTDRPDRRAALRPTRELARYWTRLFGDDPPNAALTITTPSRRPFAKGEPARAGQDTIVFELRSPRYDGKANTLTFNARKIAEPPAGLTGLNPRRGFTPPARFGEAALFIDDESNAITNCFIQIDNHTGNLLTHMADWSADGATWSYGGDNDSDMVAAVSMASGPTPTSMYTSSTGYPAYVPAATWGYFMESRYYSGWSLANGGCVVDLQMGYDADNYIWLQVADFDEYGSAGTHCHAAGVFVGTMSGLERKFVNDSQGNPITTAVFTITEAPRTRAADGRGSPAPGRGG
jgi:hypothetical protein